MRRLRAKLSQHDSAQRLRELGIDVFLGRARFRDRETLEVGGVEIRFRKAVIATGARPKPLEIEGLSQAGYLTNETVFNLKQRPGRLLVIGGGPLGCELAQAFSRLGCRVAIVQKEPQFLPKEERDAAQILAQAFEREGIRVHLNTEVTRVALRDGQKTAELVSAGRESSLVVDEILAGPGRAPNVRGLDLERAGVAYDEVAGVRVDDRLRTTNPRVFAAGDVCLETKFTHMADETARIVVHNALFFGRRRLSSLIVPWCTYTDPEIAHVGMYVREAVDRGIPVKTFTIPMHDVDRAVTDGEHEGFFKVHVRDGTDRILGATAVSRHAGEMISELTLAMEAGVGLKTIARVIHPYPTQAEAIRKAADANNRARLTPLRKRLLARWLAWRR
jgi:pyruvate/2-oxoglutarate dehydrogenase complex dihydrolipoamide dehydrogenase (E3) component